jgi:hypothetical protein
MQIYIAAICADIFVNGNPPLMHDTSKLYILPMILNCELCTPPLNCPRPKEAIKIIPVYRIF